jgi:hypothetical protein
LPYRSASYGEAKSRTGTGSDTARCQPMTNDIDKVADECREAAERHKQAASAAVDPDEKKRQNRRAKASKKTAIEIENDLA